MDPLTAEGAEGDAYRVVRGNRKRGTLKQGKFLLLADGPLMQRHVHGRTPGPWTQVGDLPVPVDGQAWGSG
jgi:hypothetical protein